jgi:hypothetical protein
MFHAPHDVQLLLKLRCADVALDAHLRAELAAKPERWTLEPKRFDLSRLHHRAAEPLRSFRARLLPEHRSQSEHRFVWLGAGREQFLLKYLDQRPDLDMIGRFMNRQPLQRHGLLRLPSPGLRAPPAAALMQALRQAGAQPLAAPHWIYSETGDLA